MFMGTLAFGYTFGDPRDPRSLDLMLGARFGYRTLHYKIESNTQDNEFDGAFQGLLVGVGGTFGTVDRAPEIISCF